MMVKQLLQRNKPLNSPLIAIDLMGCPQEPLAIAESVMAMGSSCRFLFLAHENVTLPASYNLQKVHDLFEADDAPLFVARRKTTSLVKGIKLLAAGEVDALVTAGDTGCLVAASRLFLKPLLPSRITALMTKLPTLKGHVLIGDIGAHVNAKAGDFVDFAKLGLGFLRAEGISRPRMAMLNIGTEPGKGPSEWVKANQLLQDLASREKLDFLGNVEASDLFMEDLGLVITDALAGNILLKTAEGVAKMVMKTSKNSAPSWLDWSAYPGALLVGLSRPVVKVHGYSPEKAFTSAIASLENLLQNDIIGKMTKSLYVC